jgi:RNA polymerase sigma-70 factor, ECF subfamily
VFDRQFRPHIAAALGGEAWRTLIDETMQRLAERLFVGAPDHPPRIREYSGRSDLGRWVRVVALRLAADVLRGPGHREVLVEQDDLAELALPARAPELELLRTRYGEQLRSAVVRAFAALPPATRVALRQYYFDNLGVEELGRLYGVAPSTVSRRLAKARAQVLDETRRIMRDELGLGDSEVDSIVRVMHTSLTSVAGAVR